MVRLITKGLGACALLYSMSAQADYLPKNNLHLQDKRDSKSANVTKAQFEAIIAKADSLYRDIVEGHGATLEIIGDWEDSEVNASAEQEDGTWYVNMYGGLARREELTADGFTLVVCHELGHHLGGYAFHDDQIADEGQADYFATQTCARRFWANDSANISFRSKAPESVKATCNKVWTSTADRDLCYRSMLASKSAADLLAVLNEQEISFDTPDTNEVFMTDHNHPDSQCRLDTYMAAALCKANFDVNVIPGKINGVGENSVEAEQEAALYSCIEVSTYEYGFRPRCWFKSLL